MLPAYLPVVILIFHPLFFPSIHEDSFTSSSINSSIIYPYSFKFIVCPLNIPSYIPPCNFIFDFHHPSHWNQSLYRHHCNETQEHTFYQYTFYTRLTLKPALAFFVYRFFFKYFVLNVFYVFYFWHFFGDILEWPSMGKTKNHI